MIWRTIKRIGFHVYRRDWSLSCSFWTQTAFWPIKTSQTQILLLRQVLAPCLQCLERQVRRRRPFTFQDLIWQKKKRNKFDVPKCNEKSKHICLLWSRPFGHYQTLKWLLSEEHLYSHHLELYVNVLSLYLFICSPSKYLHIFEHYKKHYQALFHLKIYSYILCKLR